MREVQTFEVRPSHARNVALDYVRAAALVLMCLAHMWRWMLAWSGLDLCVLAVVDASTCLFLVAFGMTQRLAVGRPDDEQLEYLLILGVIAALHCYFSANNLAWEFFLLFWASALFITVGDRLGMGPRQFLWLAVGLAVLNVFVLLGINPAALLELVDPYILFTDTTANIRLAGRLWVLPGPYFPLPWAILAFFGFWIGVDYPRRAAPAVLSAVVLGICLAVIRVLAGGWPELAVAHHLALSKWAVTSTYLLAGAAYALLLLGAFRALHAVGVARRFVYPPVRFLSDHLLEGTVFHYLVIGVLISPRWGWTGGALGPRAPLSAVLLASVLNVMLLVGGLKLAVSGWTLLRTATVPWIGEINIERLAGACLAGLVALHVAHVFGALSDLNLRRLAYAAMLALALAYGDARRRRRRGRQPNSSGVAPLERAG